MKNTIEPYKLTQSQFIDNEDFEPNYNFSREFSAKANLRVQYYIHVYQKSGNYRTYTIFDYLKLDNKELKKITGDYNLQKKYLISEKQAKKRIHEKIIIEALKENKDVPQNVLADYPKLQKKKSRKRINQYELNLEIEKLIKSKDLKNESYSQSEIDFIQQYEGSGGLASKGAKGTGLLHEFYTPDYICEYLYKFALKYGYDGGTILEPSIATGRIIKPFPDKSKVVGFEINSMTKRICEISYPEATIYNQYFETAFLEAPRFRMKLKNKTTWLKQYPFSLVIGNPPYGIYQNLYSAYFTRPKFKQIEQFFMYYGLKMLKKDGLLIFVTSSNFMRNWTTYHDAKEHIFSIAEFVDAYRLPAIFKNSDVPTDILIFRKK